MESLTTIAGLPIADFGISDQPTDAVKSFNQRANSVIESAKELLEDLRAAPELLALDPGKLIDRVAKLKNRRAAILAAARDTWRDRISTLREIECAIRDELESLTSVLADAEATAAKQLAAVGIGPHTMPAWHQDPEVAEHQFRLTHIARAQSVVDASFMRDQRLGDLRSINTMIEQSRFEADRAAADLERVIARELAIA